MSAAKRTDAAPAGLPRIFTVRGKRVVMDAELAKLYGVPTFRLNEAVKRNASRFPEDFSFVLTQEEIANLISQSAISGEVAGERLRSQFAILKKGGRGQHRKYLPRVFTGHGALMAANVLRSAKAIEMSLYLVRAFVKMREALLENATILKRLAEIDKRLVEHDSVLREVIARLQPLLDAPAPDDETKPKIGFHRDNR